MVYAWLRNIGGSFNKQVPADVTFLVGNYSGDLSMDYSDDSWAWQSYTGKYSVAIAAGEAENTVELLDFPYYGSKAIGTVDFDAKEITFDVQDVYPTTAWGSDAETLIFDTDEAMAAAEGAYYANRNDLKGVKLTYDENGVITFENWAVGMDIAKYFADNDQTKDETVLLSYRKVNGSVAKEVAADISFLAGNYEISDEDFVGEYVDEVETSVYEWYTWFIDEPLAVTVELVEGDNAINSICLKNFPYEGYTAVGKVDVENGVIDFLPQVTYTDAWEEYELPIYVFGTSTALAECTEGYWQSESGMTNAVAKFDAEKKTITLENWAFGTDWESYYGASYAGYAWADYRNVNATLKLTSESGVSTLGAVQNGVVKYYDIQGRAVKASDNMPSGLYIRIENGKAQKVLVK